MHSMRELEGYVRIDHRDSPGITPEQAARAGRGTIPVGKGRVFEAPTFNCSHCSIPVIMNPLRTRERGYCPKCSRNVCDRCEAIRVASGFECIPMKKRVDLFLEKAAKGLIHGS